MYNLLMKKDLNKPWIGVCLYNSLMEACIAKNKLAKEGVLTKITKNIDMQICLEYKV